MFHSDDLLNVSTNKQENVLKHLTKAITKPLRGLEFLLKIGQEQRLSFVIKLLLWRLLVVILKSCQVFIWETPSLLPRCTPIHCFYHSDLVLLDPRFHLPTKIQSTALLFTALLLYRRVYRGAMQ